MLVHTFLYHLGLGSPNQDGKLAVQSPEVRYQLGEESVAIPTTESSARVEFKTAMDQVVELTTYLVEARR